MQCPPTSPGRKGRKFHLVPAASRTSRVSIPIRVKILESSFTNAMLMSRWLFSITFAASATFIVGARWVPASQQKHEKYLCKIKTFIFASLIYSHVIEIFWKRSYFQNIMIQSFVHLEGLYFYILTVAQQKPKLSIVDIVSVKKNYT